MAYVLTFFSLISEGIGGVYKMKKIGNNDFQNSKVGCPTWCLRGLKN